MRLFMWFMVGVFILAVVSSGIRTGAAHPRKRNNVSLVQDASELLVNVAILVWIIVLLTRP